MVDQIRADQQRAACTDCATALDLTGQATLTAADGSAYDLFGYSVAISGDTVIVGAVYHDVAGNEDRGAAYIFGRNQGGADQWGQVARLTAADGSAYDEFGWSVAISGDTALVGAPSGDVGSNTNQGSAYVFGRNQDGTDHWGQVARLTAADASAYDLLAAPWPSAATRPWSGRVLMMSAATPTRARPMSLPATRAAPTSGDRWPT